MTFAIGLVMLFVVAAIIMAIVSAAGKGGPLLLPLAVILLGIAIAIDKGMHG
jgi:hypothetical protein